MDVLHNDFEKIISIENIFRSWSVFKAEKKTKSDVVLFERNLEDNLFSLEIDLKNETYKHGGYKHFTVSDPKKRDIHKAEVRDRIVHQMLYTYLVRLFEPDFIEHSYSSRINKGVHKGVSGLKKFSEEISKKNFGHCYAVKCDARKYFDNIDHYILFQILKNKVGCQKIRRLLLEIINSFEVNYGKGVPLGNVTSQIFANIYLNELDWFVSKKLRICYYLRYNDDFIILGSDRRKVCEAVRKAIGFVQRKLFLEIPKEKAVFRKLKWGIDFCGYVVLPNGIILRSKTKRRMMKNLSEKFEEMKKEKISQNDFVKTLNSYFGLLKHCNAYDLKEKIINKFIYEKFF